MLGFICPSPHVHSLLKLPLRLPIIGGVLPFARKSSSARGQFELQIQLQIWLFKSSWGWFVFSHSRQANNDWLVWGVFGWWRHHWVQCSFVRQRSQAGVSVSNGQANALLPFSDQCKVESNEWENGSTFLPFIRKSEGIRSTLDWLKQQSAHTSSSQFSWLSDANVIGLRLVCFGRWTASDWRWVLKPALCF